MDESRRILREREVIEMTGVSRSSLRRWEKKGDFPKRLKLGPRAVGWRGSDIHRWLRNRKPTG